MVRLDKGRQSCKTEAALFQEEEEEPDQRAVDSDEVGYGERRTLLSV